jgi:hypothetical protein
MFIESQDLYIGRVPVAIVVLIKAKMFMFHSKQILFISICSFTCVLAGRSFSLAAVLVVIWQ